VTVGSAAVRAGHVVAARLRWEDDPRGRHTHRQAQYNAGSTHEQRRSHNGLSKNRRRRLQDARCETKTAVTIKRFIYQPHPRIAAAEAARVADTQQI